MEDHPSINPANDAEQKSDAKRLDESVERVKLRVKLSSEPDQERFLDDFILISRSNEQNPQAIEDCKKTFKAQSKETKQLLGMKILEKMEESLGAVEDVGLMRQCLRIAELINLPKESALDKEDERDLSELIKKLEKLYLKKSGLTGGQKAVMGTVAALSTLGVAHQAFGLKTNQSESTSQSQPSIVEMVSERMMPVGIAESVPAPKEKSIPEQEEERLVPHAVRVLQNPELNKLYQEGCLDLKEMQSGGKKIMVVDFVKKPGVSCDMKFPQVYEVYPVKDRVNVYKVEGDTQIRVNQIDVTCAIHSFTIAALIAQNRANPTETPVIVNPFLYAEAMKLTPEEYNELQQSLMNDPAYKQKYDQGALEQFARSSVINNATQRNEVTERVFSSIYGIDVNRSVKIDYPEKIPGTNQASLDKSMFTESEWEDLGQKYLFSVEENRVIASVDQASKMYGFWLEKWYRGTTEKAITDSKATVPILNLRYYPEGVNHAYVVTGIKEINGIKYFQATDGLSGVMSSFLISKGAKQSEGGTVLLPLDSMWEIGLDEIYTFTAKSHQEQISSQNRQEEQEMRENKERLRTDQIGLRVNSVEAIRQLPEGIGTIRIAGNETAVGSDGRFVDKNLEAMMVEAKKRGLEVIFVYNPNWFPGAESLDKRVRGPELDKELEVRGTKEQMRKQLETIMRFDNVIVEIGNEPDENIDHHGQVVFWQGDLNNFATFVKTSTNIISQINSEKKANNPAWKDVKTVLGAFADPVGKKDELAELAVILEKMQAGTDYIGIHAYDISTFKNALDLYPQLFKGKKFIITEANVDSNKLGYQEDFREMLRVAREKGVLIMVHEFKPEAVSGEKDYTGGQLALISNDDPRLLSLVNSANERIAQLQSSANIALLNTTLIN